LSRQGAVGSPRDGDIAAAAATLRTMPTLKYDCRITPYCRHHLTPPLPPPHADITISPPS